MAMFENFPYTDMHNLNLDWIIKIAKDFLDQYTHIQELISQGIADIGTETDNRLQQLQNTTENGLQELQDKADTIQSLLDAWYTEHSDDIADQLADALSDLNSWYTEHLAYLNNYVTESIAEFTDEVNEIGTGIIQSLPLDYNLYDYFVKHPFLNESNMLRNPYFTLPDSDWLLSSGVTATGDKTLHIVADGNTRQTIKQLFKTSDFIAGQSYLYNFMFTGSGAKRWGLYASNAQGEEGARILQHDSNRNPIINAKFTFPSDVSAEYVIIQISFTGAQDVYMFRPWMGRNNNNYTFYSSDLEYIKNIVFPNTIVFKEFTIPEINDYYIKTDGDMSDGANCIALSVRSGETYKIKCSSGSNVHAYILKDSYGTVKSYYQPDEPWRTLHNYDIELTIPNTCNGGTLYINTIGQKYVGYKKAIPLYASENGQVKNPLILKEIVFDGDSICHATSETNSDRGGYAYRIGTDNIMIWHNEGVSGGTITAETYSESTPRHWVSRNIDTIHTNYPNADYIILEGGVNDADLNIALGTFSESGFDVSSFDDTTYLGALEKLFAKAVSYYPNGKVAFIIPPKMGYQSPANADYSAPANRKRVYFDYAIEVCKKWGVPYLDLWNESPMNPSLTAYYDAENPDNNAYTDGEHFTKIGFDRMTPAIQAFIQNL